MPIGRAARRALDVYLRELRPGLVQSGVRHCVSQCARRSAHAHGRAGRSFASTSNARVSRNGLRRIRCGTRLRRTCSKAAPTWPPCRRCSATPTFRPRRFTRMSTANTCGTCIASFTHGRSMILVIDNYDSFTCNLVQLSATSVSSRSCVATTRSRWMRSRRSRPSASWFRPGRAPPREAGISVPVIQRFGSAIPILGVCLGHQSIGAAYGGQRRPRPPDHAREAFADRP